MALAPVNDSRFAEFPLPDLPVKVGVDVELVPKLVAVLLPP